LAAKENLSACNSSTVTNGNSCVFYDVTSGNNAMVCVTGTLNCVTSVPGDALGVLSGYNAGTGYDPATGLGSVNAANLVKAWPAAILPAQSISFPSPGTLTYGEAPVTLKATASSGLPVSYIVLSGPAVAVSNMLVIQGAGAVTVEARQIGSSSYAGAPPVEVTFTINPAQLTVTANYAVALEGTAIPALTGTLTGLVAGDGITASYTTTAVQGSPVGTYAIVPSLNDPDNRLPNYTVTINDGTLVIYPSQEGQFLLSQSSATQDATGFTLTVYGAGFTSNTVVLWNGAARVTTFVTSNQLQAAILSADLAHEGTYTVTVANGAPLPSVSVPQPFVVMSSSPVASITRVARQSLSGGGHEITLTGSDFLPSSTVQWNGTSLSTVYLSPWEITATVPSSSSLPAALTVLDSGVSSAPFELQ
jgi:hypothetical protein